MVGCYEFFKRIGELCSLRFNGEISALSLFNLDIDSSEYKSGVEAINQYSIIHKTAERILLFSNDEEKRNYARAVLMQLDLRKEPYENEKFKEVSNYLKSVYLEIKNNRRGFFSKFKFKKEN